MKNRHTETHTNVSTTHTKANTHTLTHTMTHVREIHTHLHTTAYTIPGLHRSFHSLLLAVSLYATLAPSQIEPSDDMLPAPTWVRCKKENRI